MPSSWLAKDSTELSYTSRKLSTLFGLNANKYQPREQLLENKVFVITESVLIGNWRPPTHSPNSTHYIIPSGLQHTFDSKNNHPHTHSIMISTMLWHGQRLIHTFYWRSFSRVYQQHIDPHKPKTEKLRSGRWEFQLRDKHCFVLISGYVKLV